GQLPAAAEPERRVDELRPLDRAAGVVAPDPLGTEERRDALEQCAGRAVPREPVHEARVDDVAAVHEPGLALEVLACAADAVVEAERAAGAIDDSAPDRRRGDIIGVPRPR